MVARRPALLADFFRRLVGTGSAALVFALTVFSASPRLHDELHTSADVAHGDGCAVAMFAAGVSLPFAPLAPLPPPDEWRAQPSAVSEGIFLTSPRYLHQPERGPPVLG